MSVFTAAQLALLSATTVRPAMLVSFAFDPVMRYWNGSYTLTAGGYDWNGLGGLAQVDGLLESRAGQSSQVRFTLSGTSAEINRLAMKQASEQAGVIATVYTLLMDADWQPVGNPIPIWTGITQPLTAASVTGEEGEGRLRSITLPAENLFFGRARPAAGLYTDRDQQARHPGDLFFEFQPRLKNFTYVWP